MRLRDVIGRLHAFWAGSEPMIDRWADTHPTQAAELDWARRRRTDRLAADLARLGGSPLDPAPVVFGLATGAPDDADVLGWLYVVEGSTLGGAVINRVLHRRPGSLRVDSFMPYAEGPGPMWLSLVRHLEQWTGGDELRLERVAAAGVRTFAALEAWVAPLAKAVAV